MSYSAVAVVPAPAHIVVAIDIGGASHEPGVGGASHSSGCIGIGVARSSTIVHQRGLWLCL
jgi:hypothetical protein